MYRRYINYTSLYILNESTSCLCILDVRKQIVYACLKVVNNLFSRGKLFVFQGKTKSFLVEVSMQTADKHKGFQRFCIIILVKKHAKMYSDV